MQSTALKLSFMLNNCNYLNLEQACYDFLKLSFLPE